MAEDPARPSLWRFVGLGAAAVLAAASYGAGSRPKLHTAILWPGLEWQVPTGGSPLLATVSILAMGVLVAAWWRLREAWVSVMWWQVTAALWFAPLLASAPLYSRDLYSYAAQGALWADGLNPYEHTVRELESGWRDSTAPTWLDTPTPYGPIWLLLARGVATVSGGQLWLALLLLRLIAVIGVVVIAWAVADVAGRLGASVVHATWLGVACPLVGVHFVSGAHNDALLVAAVLAAVALALRRRFVVACLVLALGAMVKVTAVVALPFIALLWAHSLQPRRPGASSDAVLSWGRVVRAGLLSLLVAGVPMVVASLATRLGFGWVNPAATPGRNEQWTSIATSLGITVQAIGHVLGQDDWREPAIAAARAAGLVLLALLLVLVWLGDAKALDRADLSDGAAAREEQARVVRGIGWAMLAAVVLAPVFLPWYYLWVLPVLAVSLEPRLGRRAATTLAAVASVVCFMTLPEGFSLALRTTAVGVPIALVATVLLVRAGARTGRRLDWRHLADLSRPLLPRRSP